MAPITAQELKTIFLKNIFSLPDGERIKHCQQCGTCSSSCPTASSMDYSPREIIAALRAGMLDRVLESNTPWLCSSCYSCTVRCPAGIKFTDIMYELKRLSGKYGYSSHKSTTAQMANAFCHTVDRWGKNAEGELLLRYYLRTNPMKALEQLGLGLRMLIKGRLPILPHRIRKQKSLRRMINAVKERGVS